MTLIQSHSCEKCGGALLIDVEKQMYVCPFCGVTFDYDYFREENVMSLADAAMLRGEYVSAKEAYEFMLTKEPHNFAALRGLLFCSVRVRALHEAKDIKKNAFNSKNEVLDRCIRDTEEKGRAYFQHVEKAGVLAEDYKSRLREIHELEDKRSSVVKTISELEREKQLNDTKASAAISGFLEGLSPKGRENAIGAAIGAFALWIASIVLVSWIMIPVVLVPVAIGITIYMIGKKRRAAQLDAQIRPELKKREELEEQISKMRDESEVVRKQYNQEFNEAVASDPEPIKMTAWEIAGGHAPDETKSMVKKPRKRWE